MATASNLGINGRLGADLKFPIAGNFEPINSVDLLLQDIQRLLLTIPGERPMRPDFGCHLRNQLWENLEDAAQSGAVSIRRALEQFEPRITLRNVSSNTNTNTGLITFGILFQINNTDDVLNLVFPFRAGSQLSAA